METKSLKLSRRISVIVMGCVLLLITPGFSVSAQPTKQEIGIQEQEIQFGGTYANLKPAQQRLVDKWFRQYNEITKQNLKPAEEYDGLLLSTRTTFEAVTHALLTSKLTDQSARSLGTTIDLILYVETVHGKIPRTRGDLQFRIYVALKPTALEVLEASREFRRGRDNTVFHKGYPVNYRQQGGVPSIQISTSPDGKRADIDVDYRSSKFPAAVVNGHLTAANSDVRAGNNHDRHVNRWTGFGNWWRSIFGVRLKEADLKDDESRKGRVSIPRFPRAGRGKPEEAVYDFLNSWLVEQQPNQAVAYISPRAYSCIDQVASDEQKKMNPGLIPFYILEGMKKINRTLGSPARLGEVAESVRPNEPALRSIAQPHSAEFDLFETPDDIAFDFECVNRNRLPDETEKGKPRRRYGRFVGASLRLKSPQAKGDRVLILWTRESGYWKIISWSIEPDQLAGNKAPKAAAPKATQAAAAETKLDRVAGDPGMIAAAAGFFDAWFVKQNFDQAAGYVSEQCYPCINLYLDEEAKKVRNWKEGRLKLREGMRHIGGKIGRKDDVSEAIESIVPAHPALKLVTHTQEQAYALVSVPDEIARDFKCPSQAQGVKVAEKTSGTEVFGNYYGTIFELKVDGTPAALILLWGREKDQWKIIAYSIEIP
jgi:hypothetical protein